MAALSELESLLNSGRRVRTAGIDDSPFTRGQAEQVQVFATICSDVRLEGLLSTYVGQDGFDATERLINMLTGSKFLPQIHAVLLDGVTLGGFNIVDLPRLAAAIDRPVVSVMRKPPNFEAVRAAMAKLSDFDRRIPIIDRAGDVHSGQNIWFQAHGLDVSIADRLLRRVTDRGHWPEPLRLAHLIAGGVVLGESGRRA